MKEYMGNLGGINMEKEEFYYLVFVLGYSLLHEELAFSGTPCDVAFEKAKDIIKDFQESDYYKDTNKSLYECLEDYLKENKKEV